MKDYFLRLLIFKGLLLKGELVKHLNDPKGLSTFKTKVHFDNVRIYPSDDDVDTAKSTDLFDRDFYRANDDDESFLQLSSKAPNKKNNAYVEPDERLVKPGRKSHN